jgi:hypothetical protein
MFQMTAHLRALLIIWVFTSAIAQLIGIGGVIGFASFAPLALEENPVFPERLTELMCSVGISWSLTALIQAAFLCLHTPFPWRWIWVWVCVQTVTWTLVSILLYASFTQVTMLFVAFCVVVFFEWASWWLVWSRIGLLPHTVSWLPLVVRLAPALSVFLLWFLWIFLLQWGFSSLMYMLPGMMVPGIVYGLIEAVTLFLPLHRNLVTKSS